MSFNHYKVEGFDRPLRLSEAHAKQIGAVRVDAEGNPVADAEGTDTPTGGPKGRKRS